MPNDRGNVAAKDLDRSGTSDSRKGGSSEEPGKPCRRVEPNRSRHLTWMEIEIDTMRSVMPAIHTVRMYPEPSSATPTMDEFLLTFFAVRKNRWPINIGAALLCATDSHRKRKAKVRCRQDKYTIRGKMQSPFLSLGADVNSV